jgi:hypothetical protein
MFSSSEHTDSVESVARNPLRRYVQLSRVLSVRARHTPRAGITEEDTSRDSRVRFSTLKDLAI